MEAKFSELANELSGVRLTKKRPFPCQPVDAEVGAALLVAIESEVPVPNLRLELDFVHDYSTDAMRRAGPGPAINPRRASRLTGS